MYRCRIGCFDSSFKAHHSKSAVSTRPGSGARKKTLLLILLVLLFSFTATAVHAYNNTSLEPIQSLTVPNQPSLRPTWWHSVELKPWPPPSTCHPFHQSSTSGTWAPSTSFQWPGFPVASRWRDLQCIGAWGVDPPQQVTHCSFVTNHEHSINIFSLLEQVEFAILPHSAHNSSAEF